MAYTRKTVDILEIRFQYPGCDVETVDQYHVLDRPEALRVLGEYRFGTHTGVYFLRFTRVPKEEAVEPMQWDCNNCHALMSCRLHFKGKGLCPACIAAAQ